MFADLLQSSIGKNKSRIVAGIDPVFEHLPRFIKDEAGALSSVEALLDLTIKRFYLTALEEIKGCVAAIKPNIAFFEQYGPAGVRVFAELCSEIKKMGLPVIADIKRGDIGSTAQAYSNAFLGKAELGPLSIRAFDVDAVTISPFLGFDTVDVFIEDCVKYKKGIFILVKTSNLGSAAIQNMKSADSGITISSSVASWIGARSSALRGKCGLSGLGAVVGATYPQEAKDLRELMPDSFFLIPGMGAQGGSAKDAVAGAAVIGGKPEGILINLSRGIFADIPDDVTDFEGAGKTIAARVRGFNAEIDAAL